MPLTPIHTAQRPTYPPWGTRLARSLRQTAIATAVPLLSVALGCAAPLPGVPVTPSIPTEIQAVQPSPAETETAEEWIDLPVQILFDLGSAELDDEDKAVLREGQVSLESRTDVLRVRVEGFAFLEREPEAGLAVARAEAVVGFFVNDLGMQRELFEVVDAGDGVFHYYATSPDRRQFSRVEFSMLVRRAR